MRKSGSNNGFKLNVISGTYVVMMGWHLPQNQCGGLMGFSIHRESPSENEAFYLKGMKVFPETDPGFPPGSMYETSKQPIQGFQWSDYSAKPGLTYTYTVTALKGTPANLQEFSSVSVDITTESPENGDQDVYFNRGIAASQEYVRRFGDQRPEDVPNDKAFEWLSRGLYEALESYINSCTPGTDELYIAAYEFYYDKVLLLIKNAIDRGVVVKFVYDARKDSPKIKNQEAMAAFGLDTHPFAFERTSPKSYISHNKFIVKVTNGVAKSVWTGGTNFSEGGIYGHSNVAHVVEDEAVAQKFKLYWDALVEKPEKSSTLKQRVEALSPLPVNNLTDGTHVVFSPRKTIDALDWYAQLAKNAQEGLFMTFAFGMNDVFKDVYENGQAPFRVALLDKLTRGFRDPADKTAEEQKMQLLRNKKENVFAVGNFVRTHKIDGWLKEKLTTLNFHVRYVHNKFMLIDPLSDSPIVVAGSANFSEASTIKNDENMVVVKGNTRVADMYLGEFMRLHTHHAFRESLAWRKPNDPPRPLSTGNWWQDYFGETPRSIRRRFFARLDE
ncbi:phospholipase D-like domain-containing protein [Flagellimonas sp.]|uniref:phospholipase D-like domain-containing protein n=1 Tax=Flagellimonas sp. TaxID=2058762 RepID=UPI003BA9A929